MTVCLGKLHRNAQVYGIKNKEFEKNVKDFQEWNRQIGEELPGLVNRASKLAEQTTHFNSKKRKPSNGASGLFCVALSLFTVLAGVVLMTRVNMTLGAIIIAVGCLGLAISLYKAPQFSLQNLSEASQHKGGIEK